jgi:regulator of protease activity HflC (stomatin/prohibitin superfamily)
MFDFDHPVNQRGAEPNLAHIAIAGTALTVVLFVMAFTPDPASRFGSFALHLLEFAPSILMLLATRFRASAPATAGAVAFTLGGETLAVLSGYTLAAPVGALAGLYLFLSVKVADQWEKCAVLRFGRYHGLRGPGIFRIVPIVDRVAAYVDERVRTTAVYAEAALTRDAVPANVDAVVFWTVWDVQKAVFEVQDFDRAVGLIAQTALLESIGRHALGDMIAERGSLGRDLQQVLRDKTTAWGITVQSVEVREVRLPANLQDALSRQAQAERERQARIIYGTTELELAGKFAEASRPYQDDPVALHLRAMNMLFEAIKEKGSMVVVPTSSLAKKSRGRRH